MNLAELILTPGTGVKVVPIINTALVLLIIVLALSAIRWHDSSIVIHLGAMGILAVMLFITINWFANELQKTKSR